MYDHFRSLVHNLAPLMFLICPSFAKSRDNEPIKPAVSVLVAGKP